jgi:hypothetical protein
VDYRALADEVWQCELAAHRQIIEHEAAAARAATAPDLIHILADGQRSGAELYLERLAAGDGPRCTAIDAGPVEALVFSAQAVLLTYPLAAHIDAEGAAHVEYEHASILWLRRAGRWLMVWIHATPIQAPEGRLADAGACGRLVTVLDCAVEGEMESEDVADDLTLGERRWEAIAGELASVQNLTRHDTAAATTAAAAGLIGIAGDGSRYGRDAWLALVGDWRRTLTAADFGPMQVIVVSPSAMLVVYTLDTQGTYDGAPFTNREALSSLWLRRQGQWQNIFVQATLR